MPTHYARFLIGRHRTVAANRQLGWLLAMVAGAINAGGYLAVRQYTSHVTGIVSAVADNLALGQLDLVVDGVIGVLSFLLGAMCSGILVNFARRRALASAYALPLLLESVLILGFGLLGARMATFEGLLLPFTVILLCFIMGLQNAIVTKISQAEIRTTHMTGIVTDLGIEIGRLLYWNRSREGNDRHFVRANRDKLAIHATILGLFFIGGLIGALAFKRVGFSATVPIAALLMALAAPPLWQDLKAQRTRKPGVAPGQGSST